MGNLTACEHSESWCVEWNVSLQAKRTTTKQWGTFPYMPQSKQVTAQLHQVSLETKKSNIENAWPHRRRHCLTKLHSEGLTPPPHHLSSQNQFIGNEDMSGRWLTTPCVHLIFSEGGFAAGFITTSDLISFSYASKSQVRRTFGMIQGEWPTHSNWTPGINLGKSSMLTCLVVT